MENKSKEYSLTIELDMRKVFQCGRYGIGGLVNSDSILSYPYFSMVATLTFDLATATSSQKESIEKFCENYYHFAAYSIDTLLELDKAFDENKEIEGISNGKEELEKMIRDFEAICFPNEEKEIGV